MPGRDAEAPAVLAELENPQAGQRVRELGMRFNAGHALNYYNVSRSPVWPVFANCTSATPSSAAPFSLACAKPCGK
jgi:hypothetical protein